MKCKKVLILLIFFLIPIIRANASTFSISASSKNVFVGSNVTIYINGSDVTGRVNITSSNTSVLSSGTSNLWIEPSGTVTFKANKVGSATVTVSTESLSNGNGDDVNLGSKTITINVINKPIAASSNNSLKSLSINNGELSPSFDPGTTEYNVNMPVGTTNVEVNAELQDPDATLVGTGNINVTEGINTINVSVTAQNGYTKTYVLNILIESDPIIINMDMQDYTLMRDEKVLPSISSFYSKTSLKYKYTKDSETIEYDIPAYYSDITKFTLVALKDEDGSINLYIYNADDNSFKKYKEFNFSPIVFYQLDFPKDKLLSSLIKTNVTIGETKIGAYVYEKDSDFYLVYGMNVETGDKGWFQYDIKNNTIQRYDMSLVDKLLNDNKKYLSIVCVLSSVCFIIMLILLIEVNKDNKRKNEV